MVRPPPWRQQDGNGVEDPGRPRAGSGSASRPRARGAAEDRSRSRPRAATSSRSATGRCTAAALPRRRGGSFVQEVPRNAARAANMEPQESIPAEEAEHDAEDAGTQHFLDVSARSDGCSESDAEGGSLELLSWEFWDGQPTLILDAGDLPQSLVRRGIHLGQKLCEGFSKKMIEEKAQWIDNANASPGLPEDTVCFDLQLHADLAANFGVDTVRAGVRGGNKKQRVQALGAALAIAVEVAADGYDHLAKWGDVLPSQQWDGDPSSFENFEALVALALERRHHLSVHIAEL